MQLHCMESSLLAVQCMPAAASKAQTRLERECIALIHACIVLACAAAGRRVQRLNTTSVGVHWRERCCCLDAGWGRRMRKPQAGSGQKRGSQHEGQHGSCGMLV